MTGILKALESLKNEPAVTGIFSDLDGTLSKIVPTPGEAIISDGMRNAIKELAKKYPVVGIVSGRDSDDAKRIVGIEDIIYVGNHGLEWIEGDKQEIAPEASPFIKLANDLQKQISDLLNGFNLLVEKKKLGVAIHYRLEEDKEGAQRHINKIIEPLLSKHPLKKAEGRFVIELKPDIPVNKGIAITTIASKKGIKKGIYLGDDVTDLDAFRALKKLRNEEGFESILIGVVSTEGPAKIAKEADYLLKNVDQVEELLSWMSS